MSAKWDPLWTAISDCDDYVNKSISIEDMFDDIFAAAQALEQVVYSISAHSFCG